MIKSKYSIEYLKKMIAGSKITDNVTIQFNKDSGQINYELNMPAIIRLRIGIVEGPLYVTLIDWQENTAGKHTIMWNGMDNTGTFNLLGNKDLTYTFNYYTKGDEDLYVHNTDDIIPSPVQVAVGKTVPIFHLNHMHKKLNQSNQH